MATCSKHSASKKIIGYSRKHTQLLLLRKSHDSGNHICTQASFDLHWESMISWFYRNGHYFPDFLRAGTIPIIIFNYVLSHLNYLMILSNGTPRLIYETSHSNLKNVSMAPLACIIPRCMWYRHVRVSLLWCHMSVIACRINDNSSISIVCFVIHQI